ncbi:helix-turn-helix domain-containing protein [Streptomyces sp. NPDC088732]|uniref:helix-turn-helix domain-containing protein n=1 Tax=Streptomyces sp. NPDC088732 TaxID=3365879 RepID=UPI0038193A03
MPYRLRISHLLDIAAQKGDTTGYAIAKRTGLSEPSVSKLLNSKTKPGVKTLLLFKEAYGGTVDDLIEIEAAA